MQFDFHCEGKVVLSAAMSGLPVELRVGGQTYRVVASTEEKALRGLASELDERVRELTQPGHQVPQQNLLLVALSLLHDLREEKARRVNVEERSKEMFVTVSCPH